MKQLYIIPTPIGNLKDITLNALEYLNAADIILAENPKNSLKLLQHYEIHKPLYPYHQHNEHTFILKINSEPFVNKSVALITDAGTPAISDPAYLLIRECILNKIPIQTLPGATAFVPALVNSGFPTDRFVFEGFIPIKKHRTQRLKELATETRTIILYEAPHKLLRTLQDLITHLGENQAVSISRELTKIYEETLRGTLSELHQHFIKHPPRGEFVIILAAKNYSVIASETKQS